MSILPRFNNLSISFIFLFINWKLLSVDSTLFLNLFSIFIITAFNFGINVDLNLLNSSSAFCFSCSSFALCSCSVFSSLNLCFRTFISLSIFSTSCLFSILSISFSKLFNCRSLYRLIMSCNVATFSGEIYSFFSIFSSFLFISVLRSSKETFSSFSSSKLIILCI